MSTMKLLPDQPVIADVSNFIPLDWSIRISAGILAPGPIITKSPTTSSSGEICISSLLRTTIQAGGNKTLKSFKA